MVSQKGTCLSHLILVTPGEDSYQLGTDIVPHNRVMYGYHSAWVPSHNSLPCQFYHIPAHAGGFSGNTGHSGNGPKKMNKKESLKQVL